MASPVSIMRCPMFLDDYDYVAPTERNIPNTHLAEAESYIQRKDFGTVIKEKQLFIAIFYKMVSLSKQSASDRGAFYVSDNGRMISGRPHILESIRESMEIVHSLFLKNFQNKTRWTLLPVKISLSYLLREDIQPDVPSIDISNWIAPNVVGEINAIWFDSLIKPHLPSLANLLGAQCTPLQVERMVDSGDGARNQVIKALQFDWNPEIHYVYPIPPQTIPSQTLDQVRALETKQHTFYKQGLFCDLTIQTKDGGIKCHSQVLALNGGEVMQAMLTQSLAESTTKMVIMEEFSKKTIEIFLEFVYLEKEAIDIQSLKLADLSELLRLAHTYQVEKLVDHCTNAISLLAETQDASDIGAMASYFNNQHLGNLAHHLAAHPKVVPKPKG